jgi:hypothetical protein
MNMLLLAAIMIASAEARAQDHNVPVWLTTDYDESYLYYPDL